MPYQPASKDDSKDKLNPVGMQKQMIYITGESLGGGVLEVSKIIARRSIRPKGSFIALVHVIDACLSFPDPSLVTRSEILRP